MDEKIFCERMNTCGIPFESGLPGRLALYCDLLQDWNTRMDLTAPMEPEEMIDRHFIDSLSVLTVPGLMPRQGAAIDVGTGAGFPGMVLAAALPEVSFTLIDSLGKRLTFLQTVADALDLKNIKLIHMRAEDAGHLPELREQFDVAMARAVAPLAVLAEYLLPFVRLAGTAICWKGPQAASEYDQGRKASHLCGGQLGEAIPVTLPGLDWQHTLVPIIKTARISKIYPRKAGTPAKKPLG